jgi:hypothetical protein
MSVDQVIDKLKLKIDEGAFTEEEKLALTESSNTVSRYSKIFVLVILKFINFFVS